MPGISGFGTTLAGATCGTIAGITRIGLQGMDCGEITITTNDSVNRWAEVIANIKDAQSVQLDLVFENEVADTLFTYFGGENEAWTITLPDNSTFVCDGYIKGIGMPIPMDDKITQTVTLRLSGEPVFTPGDSV